MSKAAVNAPDLLGSKMRRDSVDLYRGADGGRGRGHRCGLHRGRGFEGAPSRCGLHRGREVPPWTRSTSRRRSTCLRGRETTSRWSGGQSLSLLPNPLAESSCRILLPSPPPPSHTSCLFLLPNPATQSYSPRNLPTTQPSTHTPHQSNPPHTHTPHYSRSYININIPSSPSC